MERYEQDNFIHWTLFDVPYRKEKYFSSNNENNTQFSNSSLHLDILQRNACTSVD
jgi:hypothetical protein